VTYTWYTVLHGEVDVEGATLSDLDAVGEVLTEREVVTDFEGEIDTLAERETEGVIDFEAEVETVAEGEELGTWEGVLGIGAVCVEQGVTQQHLL